MIAHAIVGEVKTPGGAIPRITTRLTWRDHAGTLRVRLGIGRMSYRVPPGLYAVGEPDSESPVLVSANYKLSFDALRSELEGINAWLLVIDTDGVNVWCAAGKGTFSTDEVVRRVEEAGLERIVRRHRLILPQLAAPGVAAHEVRGRTGFYVNFGPVRARDLPAYLGSGLAATEEMRRVRFPLRDRLAVVPVELVHALGPLLVLLMGVFAAAGLSRHGFDAGAALKDGWSGAVALLGAVAAGLLITPLFLPWLPGRAFSVKGAFAGLVWIGVWMGVRRVLGLPVDLATVAVHTLFLVPVSALHALNFTGCTPFTSVSGVRVEVTFGYPAMAVSVLGGAALWLSQVVT